MTERMCIATRTVRPVDELVRFVVGPDGGVVPDIACKLPGRGVWVSAHVGPLETAVRKNLFPRAFKSAARAGSDLVALVGDLLRRRALELLGLARKAGLVRTGFAKVAEQASRKRISVVLHASDASADGVRKLMAKIAATREGESGLQVTSSFTSRELSLALGQSNVVHAALNEARLTDEFAAAARKYEGFWDEGTHSSASA